MNIHQTNIKVRYAETDQMGVVYHGNYAQYLEIGRLEWLSSLGISYKEMESNNVMLPVVELSLNYRKSAHYDDVLTISTSLLKHPTASIEFNYEIHNSSGELLTTGHTKLVFINKKSNFPMRCPQYILDKLQI
jgi:acyl-CoA thioester hydrolase